MKLLNYTYESQEALKTFIETFFSPFDHLLIQVFCGEVDVPKVTSVLSLIKNALPNSVVIGASTAGEIKNGQVKTNTLQLSFCHFETSHVKSFYFPEVTFKNGQKTARILLEHGAKACIAFAHPFGSDDSEEYIKGVNSIAAHIPLFGGDAADDFAFQRACVLFEDHLFEHGVVFVALYGENLQINASASLGWTQLGKELTITHSKGSSLYSIDDKPAKEVYLHYLGGDVLRNLPSSAIEFPFIKHSDGIDLCRSLIGVNSDGSLLFSGHLDEGEKVRFAIGNVDDVIHQATHMQAEISKQPCEAIFIYSCSARRLFLQKQIKYEFELLQQIAPTAGFFTYGEFFHSRHKNQLLNVTTTVLSLSESTHVVSKVLGKQIESPRSTLKSLTHLINTIQHELDVNVNFLNQYKMVLDHSAIVSKMNIQGIITYVNDAFCNITELTKEQILGTTHAMFRHPEADALVYKELWETLRAKKNWTGMLMCQNAKGKTFYIKSTIIPFLDEQGKIIEYITSSIDITDLVLKEQMIQKHFKDELTGVGNREALFHALRLNLKEKCLVLINLVGFSEINDYLGFDIGDELLKHIAHVLLYGFYDQKGMVFRINGDEFAVLLHEETLMRKEGLHDEIKKIVRDLEKRVFILHGYEVVVRLNVGVANGTSDVIYMQSHVALKEAKTHNQALVFYDANAILRAKTKHNLQVIQKIKMAIEQDRIVPFFQGIYNNKSHKVTKYEVLMRLHDEDGNFLSPYYFLEQAKKTRLYEKLTKIMIHKAFEFFKDRDEDFSINLTKGDILSSSVKECLFEHIRQHQCANRVILEIVESEGIENFSEIAAFIHDVKHLGCQIAIDDFGTGYSNFAYLVKLDVNFIKIDGSLIKDIDENETSALMVETIVSFAQKMGYKTVAEFVDKLSVQEKLVALGVDFSQGYLFSKPSPSLL